MGSRIVQRANVLKESVTEANYPVGTQPAAIAPPPPVHPPGVTIVLCTFNRLPLLKKMVGSILPQLPTEYPLEVLIVDNNSTDGTAEYVKALVAEYPEFSYYAETRQGLSHARNGGATTAKYDFLLYCDDDAHLPPHFIRTLGPILAEHQPDLFGGPCYPDFVDPKPAWFPESLEVRKKAGVSGFHNNVTLSGSNFGIRREVLRRLNGFNPDFGMVGNRPGMLEERLIIESYRRLTPAAQQKVYYSVETYVYHHTPASRMRLGFQLRRIYQADYELVKYSLQQGVRSPAILFSVMRKRLLAECRRFIALLPSLWQERKAHPDRPISEFMRLVYRLADVHAIAEFLLTDWGRAKLRLQTTKEKRPLDIAILFCDKTCQGAPTKQQLRVVLEHLRGIAVVRTHSALGLKDKEILSLVNGVGVRNLDVIVVDNMRVLNTLNHLRLHYPHVQLILWAREKVHFAVAQSPWRSWRTLGELISQLRRLRAAARGADQVVWSLGGRGRIARFLLGARSWVVAPNPPEGTTLTPESWRAGWQRMLEEAGLWAPRRLSPQHCISSRTSERIDPHAGTASPGKGTSSASAL